MDTSKVYRDSNGVECSVWQMVRREPDWAANRVQEGELAIEQLAALNAESQKPSHNSDYTAALKLAREYMDTNVPSHSVGDFIYQMEQRLNPPKAADCA